VPVYNKTIEELMRCFESILCQTCNDFELIIIDDGSECTIASFLDDYTTQNKTRCRGGVHCHHYPNGYVWEARNRGQRVSKGDWIMHVNADDYIECDTVESAITASKNNDSIDMVYWGLRVVDGNNQIENYPSFGGNKLHVSLKSKEYYLPQIIDNICESPFVDVTCVVRREHAAEFNPNLIGAEYERQVRVLASCRSIYFIDKLYYVHVISSSSVSRKVNAQYYKDVEKDFYEALISNGFKCAVKPWQLIAYSDHKIRTFKSIYNLYAAGIPEIDNLNEYGSFTEEQRKMLFLLKSRKFYRLSLYTNQRLRRYKERFERTLIGKYITKATNCLFWK